jgi:hypothetical protein
MPVITEEVDEPHKNTGLWPLLSLNGSDASLQGFEEWREGDLQAAEGTRLSSNLCQDGVCSGEERLTDGGVDWPNFPEWKTKPNKLRAHYEVLARVEGGQAIPERIVQVQPFQANEATLECAHWKCHDVEDGDCASTTCLLQSLSTGRAVSSFLHTLMIDVSNAGLDKRKLTRAARVSCLLLLTGRG